MRRRRFLTTAAATTPLVAGCTGSVDGGGDADGTATGATTPGSQVDETIVVENRAFRTRKADVETGATVRWVNEDGFTHDVTAAQFHDSAADWAFSETLSAGQGATFTFDERGLYEYYCTVHGRSTMCGAVLVGGATLEGSLPCDSGSDDGGGYYGVPAPDASR